MSYTRENKLIACQWWQDLSDEVRGLLFKKHGQLLLIKRRVDLTSEHLLIMYREEIIDNNYIEHQYIAKKQIGLMFDNYVVQ